MSATHVEIEPVSEDLALLLEEIRQPITESQPAGEDVTYDDQFQQLKAEVNESHAISGRIDHEKALKDGEGSIFSEERSNYAAIVERSRNILRTKSKDLRVASYLAVGLYHTRGLSGLAEGVAALNFLVEGYWESLYPPKNRLHARKQSIEFWTRRVGEALETYRPVEGDRTSFEQALAGLETLQARLASMMEEHAPVLSGLKRTIEELLRRVPTPVAPKDSAPGQPASEQSVSASQAGAAGRGAPPSAGTQSGELRSVSDAEQRAFSVTAYLRAQDKTAPAAYRLSRVLRWETLRQEPPSASGKTQMQPPPAPRRAYLRGLLEKGQYATLVDEAEVSFREPPFHFWLDLQRLTAAAMEALGAPYQEAQEALLYEAARLLRRLPGLPTLAFSDGTPFADLLTTDWIDSQVRPVLGRGDRDGNAEPAPAEDTANIERQYREARRQLGAGDLAGALAALQDGAAGDDSEHDRFRRRLYLATLCVTGGQPAVACPVLERLDEEIDRHALSAWDPALTLEVWTTLYRCYEILSGSPAQPEKQTIRARAARIFEKMCRLDAAYALSIAEKGKT